MHDVDHIKKANLISLLQAFPGGDVHSKLDKSSLNILKMLEQGGLCETG